MIVRQERIAAVALPFDRPSQLSRSPDRHDRFGVYPLHTETPPDIGRSYANLAFVVPKDESDLLSERVDVLYTGDDFGGSRFPIVDCQTASRLEWARCDAGDREASTNAMRRLTKCFGYRIGIAGAVHEAEIVGRFFPNARPRALDRVVNRDDRLQFLDVNAHGFRGITRLIAGFGYHKGHRFSQEPDPVPRERRPEGKGGCAVGTVVRVVQKVPQWPMTVCCVVCAGQYRQNTGHPDGDAGIHLEEACVRMLRPDDPTVRCPRDKDIVEITTLTLDQPFVLDPLSRLADLHAIVPRSRPAGG